MSSSDKSEEFQYVVVEKGEPFIIQSDGPEHAKGMNGDPHIMTDSEVIENYEQKVIGKVHQSLEKVNIIQNYI